MLSPSEVYAHLSFFSSHLIKTKPFLKHFFLLQEKLKKKKKGICLKLQHLNIIVTTF